MGPVVARYLARYAEPEAGELDAPERRYRFSLVIPAHRETAQQVRRVWRRLDDSPLVILVINSDTPDEDWARQLHGAMAGGGECRSLSPHIHHVMAREGPDMLLVDRYGGGRTIDSRAGVGLARKIGSDIALRLHAAKTVESDWLFTTDADAILPADYFRICPARDDAALLRPFIHRGDPETGKAALLYEIGILYYAAGLAWAKSPYACPAVGSTISCAAQKYAAVRGYPKRNTGEDFYLLNKLRKVGQVRSLRLDPVILSTRLSTRVPIGTGQAIRQILALAAPEDYGFEHPGCFAKLKALQALLVNLSARQPADLDAGDPVLDDLCRHIGLHERYQEKRRQQPDGKVMLKFLHDWFDGLRTRQAVHYLRDRHYGRIPPNRLGEAPFLAGERDLPRIRQALSALIPA